MLIFQIGWVFDGDGSCILGYLLLHYNLWHPLYMSHVLGVLFLLAIMKSLLTTSFASSELIILIIMTLMTGVVSHKWSFFCHLFNVIHCNYGFSLFVSSFSVFG